MLLCHEFFFGWGGYVWKFGPPWHLGSARFNTRHGPDRRGIISDASCPFGCQEVEVLSHLLFSCPYTSFIWQRFQASAGIGQGPLTLQDVIMLPATAPPGQSKEWATILIAIAWNIWLSRNKKVFDNGTTLQRTLEINCWETVKLWANRCTKRDRREAIKN
jgi:hypothetical protein